jgi:hypothetical protein
MWLGKKCVMASIIYRMSKTRRRVGCAGHVARMGKAECIQKARRKVTSKMS